MINKNVFSCGSVVPKSPLHILISSRFREDDTRNPLAKFARKRWLDGLSLFVASVCRVGDFVIEINRQNTQLASMNEVRTFCNIQTDHLRLRLRRTEFRTYTIQGNTDAFANWRLDLAVVFKNVAPNGYGDENGIVENDELLQVKIN